MTHVLTREVGSYEITSTGSIREHTAIYSRDVSLSTNEVDASVANYSLLSYVNEHSVKTFKRQSEASFLNPDGTISYAQNNIPRLVDISAYNSSFEGLAILLEGERTNKLLHSEDFTTTWATPGGNATVTADQETAPDEEVDADQVDFVALDNARVVQTITASAFPDSVDVTFSVYAKVTGSTELFKLRILDKDGVGTVTTDQTVTTDWQRFDVTADTGTGTNSIQFRIENGTDAQARTIFIWGAQAEEGSFPSSYIRTTAAAVTRSLDDFEYSDVSQEIRNHRWIVQVAPFYNKSEADDRLILDFGTDAEEWYILDNVRTFDVRDNNTNLGDLSAVDYDRLQVMKTIPNAQEGTITVEGAKEGDGEYTITSSGWNWELSPVKVGARSNLAALNSFYGLITEPKKRTPSDLLLSFDTGTFTRNSPAWYSTTVDFQTGSFVSASAGEARIRTAEGQREILIESNRKNHISGSSTRLNTTNWSLSSNVLSEERPSIFTGESADVLQFASLGVDASTELNGTVDDATAIISAIVQTPPGSGSQPFRLRLRRRDNTFSGHVGVTATETPSVVFFSNPLLTGSTTPELQIKNDSDGASRDVIFHHVQVETDLNGSEPDVPTSPIRKDDGVAVEREGDQIEWPIPEFLRTGISKLRFRPTYDDADSGQNVLVAGMSGGEFIQMQSGRQLRVRNINGANTTLVRPVNATYSANQALTFFFDFRNSPSDSGDAAIRVEDATTGNGTTSGDSETFTAGGTLRMGNFSINLRWPIAWIGEFRKGKPLV